MAQARPPLAYLGELARRPATQEEIGYRQLYDATYGDPTAPQRGMYLPKVGSYGEIRDQLYSTGLRGTPTPATADEYGNLYAEHANAQRSALAALGFDASRVTPSPDPGARFPLAGAYSPQTDALFVNSYAAGPKTVGSHEGMHRGIEKLKEAGMFPSLAGLNPNVNSQAGIDDHEMLVRALMVDRYGPESEGLGQSGKLNDLQIQRGMEWLAQNSDYVRQVEAAAAQLIAKNRPRGPR